MISDYFEGTTAGSIATDGTVISSAQDWAFRDAEKAAMERANIDYYNQQSLVRQEQEAQARAREREAKSDEERDLAREQADFWLQYKQTLIEIEQKAAQTNAEFSLQYYKTKAAMEVQSVPNYTPTQKFQPSTNQKSNLNFGLL